MWGFSLWLSAHLSRNPFLGSSDGRENATREEEERVGLRKQRQTMLDETAGEIRGVVEV